MIERRVQINIDGEEQVFMVPVAFDLEEMDLENEDIFDVCPVPPRDDQKE